MYVPLCKSQIEECKLIDTICIRILHNKMGINRMELNSPTHLRVPKVIFCFSEKSMGV